MHCEIKAFRLAKAGADPTEYEDAAAWTESERRCDVAVSDGATESILAGRWAETLASTFAKADPEDDLATVIATAAAAWGAVLSRYQSQRESEGRPIRWYEEAGFRRGAFATLLGVRLHGSDAKPANDRTGIFDTWAIGDSCLFHTREDLFLRSFPLTEAAEFTSIPALAVSHGSDPMLLANNIQHDSGRWRHGDTFYLTTDAVAQWLLSEIERGTPPWTELRTLKSTDFTNWISQLRFDGQIRNDDSTLVRVTIN